MPVLPIITYGNGVLRTQAAPVSGITDRIRSLAADMLDTMHSIRALGLAAPQVGEPLAMFTVNGPAAWEDDDTAETDAHDDLVVLNPVISNAAGTGTMEEGCLSVPDLRLDIKRAAELDLEYTGLDGVRRTLHAAGLLATVIQHETDHLNGVMIVDRVGALKKQMIKKHLKELETGAEH